MANNPVVNSLTFSGSVIGQASIQAQGIAGGLTFLLPNTAPVVGNLLEVQTINGNNVFLGWAAMQSSTIHLSQLAQDSATTGQFIAWNGSAWAPASTAPGEGTVTSVALTVPNILSVSGSPITSSGTLAVSLATQNANLVFAGPATGVAAVPTFRSLVMADIGAGIVSIAAINSVQGNGGYVQLSSQNGGPTALGQIAQYDDHGNVNSSGVLLSSLAPLASPALTGTPTAPTAAALTNTTQIATTAFTTAAVGVETSRAQAAESTNASAISTETSRAEAAEALLAPLAGAAFTGGVSIAPSGTAKALQVTGDANSSDIADFNIHGFPGGSAMYIDNLGNVHFEVGLFDNSGSAGTSGQVLSAGAGGHVAWLSQSAITAGTISGSITESQVTNLTSDLAAKAPLASPTFTGVPAAPTATPLTNSTQIATTAYTDAAVAVETTRAEAAEATKAVLMDGTGAAPAAGDNHIASGTATLTGGTVTVTLTGSAVFASTNYVVQATYISTTATKPLEVTITDTANFTISNATGGDNTSTLAWTAIGF